MRYNVERKILEIDGSEEGSFTYRYSSFEPNRLKTRKLFATRLEFHTCSTISSMVRKVPATCAQVFIREQDPENSVDLGQSGLLTVSSSALRSARCC